MFTSTTLNGFITNVDNVIINPLIALLFALAVVYFLYGMLEFLMNQANDEKKNIRQKSYALGRHRYRYHAWSLDYLGCSGYYFGCVWANKSTSWNSKLTVKKLIQKCKKASS